ncbi:MAG: sigma-54-dependent transcriptional regulator [Myxococcaceae bacterium]
MADTTGSVLLVDDDPAVGKVLTALLHQAGLQSHHVTSAESALQFLDKHAVDVVVSDVRMPSMDGMALLNRVAERWPELPVIMLTAHGTVPMAVEAMKLGAADFVIKPFDREELLFSVRKALTQARHSEQLPQSAPLPGGIIGASAPMKEVSELIRRSAGGTATVLIRGESGTGKELAARAIHEQSPRRTGPFVKIHCAALPDTLLESELFGYEKGAFTGAANRKPGRVELADGGTLFLDEIGDITPATQVKLLRLLQDREFERLGGTQTLKVDLRLVAATHRDLEAMVKKNEFREDLFYRLNVVPVWMPPLRDRLDDLESLARHFCATLSTANGKPGITLDDDALALLMAQPWPGNVRQLQNFIERLIVLAQGQVLDAEHVRRELGRSAQSPATSSNAPAPAAPESTLDQQRRATEKEALLQALQRANDNRTVAARLLGISRRTLYNKLQEHGLT